MGHTVSYKGKPSSGFGMILTPNMRFVPLDVMNIALCYDYLDIGAVVAFLKDEKPEMTHVCLTGRNAKPKLLELADLVTEMRSVKHLFRNEIETQPGVEFNPNAPSARAFGEGIFEEKKADTPVFRLLKNSSGGADVRWWRQRNLYSRTAR